VPNPGPGKALCEAQRTNQSKGLTCHLVAGYGTDHVGVGRCKWHGGCTPTHNEHAQVEQIKQMAVRISGSGENVTPVQAVQIVMGSLNAAWWNVHRYEELVAELPTHPEPDELIDDPSSPTGKRWQRGKPGLYGPTYHQSGIPTGEAKKHILLQMLDEERKKAFDWAAEASKQDVDAKLLHLAELQVGVFFDAIGEAMTALSLSAEQVEVFQRVIAQSLRRAQPVALTG
jgi:hypothetical protein